MFEEVLESLPNLEELLNLDYDLELLKRIENNELISEAEYFYVEYTLPIKLMALKKFQSVIKNRGD